MNTRAVPHTDILKPQLSRRSFFSRGMVATGGLALTGRTAWAATPMALKAQVLTIIHDHFPWTLAHPASIATFAEDLVAQRFATLEEMTFIKAEAKKLGGELFERYVLVEFTTSATYLELTTSRPEYVAESLARATTPTQSTKP